jgi:hypothetical protein
MPAHPLLSTLLHAFPRDGRPQQLLEIHIWEYKTGQLAKRFGRQRVRPVLHPRPLSSGPESGLVNQLFALVGYALCAHLFDATLVLPDFESHDHHGTQLPFATLFEVEPLIEALRAANVSAITRDSYGQMRAASNAARGRNRRASANATVATSTGTSTSGIGTTVVRCGWSCRNVTGGAGAAMVVNVLQGDALLGWRAYKALQRILFLRANVSAPEAARLRALEASVYRGLQVARAVRESVRQAERTLHLRLSTRVGGLVPASSSNRGGGSSSGSNSTSGSTGSTGSWGSRSKYSSSSSSKGIGGAGDRVVSRGPQDDGPDDAPSTDEELQHPELPAYGCMHARIEADMIKSQAFNYAGRPPRLDDYLPPLAPVALRATPMVFVAVGTDISAADDERLLRRAPWGALLVRTGREAKSHCARPISPNLAQIWPNHAPRAQGTLSETRPPHTHATLSSTWSSAVARDGLRDGRAPRLHGCSAPSNSWTIGEAGGACARVQACEVQHTVQRGRSATQRAKTSEAKRSRSFGRRRRRSWDSMIGVSRPSGGRVCSSWMAA